MCAIGWRMVGGVWLPTLMNSSRERDSTLVSLIFLDDIVLARRLFVYN